MTYLGSEKNAQPLVSVIIPIYNVAEYLPKCLDSLLGQTLKDIEIICVNDGSTDNSGKVLAEYAEKDPRIKVITQPNRGISMARNVGIKIARADCLGFVDPDDWVEADTYETTYCAMKNADLVCFGTNLVGDTSIGDRESDIEYFRLKYSGLHELTDDMRLNTDSSVWNKLFSTKLIREYGLEFPVGKLYEDFSFYWRYVLVCHTVYFIPEFKYNYLRRSGSIMAETFKGSKRAIEHLLICPEIYRFADERGLWDNRRGLLNSLFLKCFWFAYQHVPVDMRKEVLELGTKEVREIGLAGNPVIDALAKGDYSEPCFVLTPAK